MKTDLFEIFYSPIIVYKKGNDDSYIQGLIVADRWDLSYRGEWSKAPYSEVICYLNSLVMTVPLNSWWYEIYFWTAAQVIPGLGAVLSIPDKVSNRQMADLESLQVWIRNSQIKHWRKLRKEVQMKVKEILHIVVREDDTLVAYQKDGCDHYDTVVSNNNILAVCVELPNVVAAAEKHWEEQGPKNPVAPTPKKTEKAATQPRQTGAQQVSSQSQAEELPLLKELETKQKDKEPEKATQLEEIEESIGKAKEEAEQTGQPVVTATQKPSKGQVKPKKKPAAGKTDGKVARKDDKPTKKNVQYRLTDGQGPFENIQQCLDALGFDKENRPKHNRWPRLSKELQEKIKVEEMSV